MRADELRQAVLLNLAAEGIGPVVAGCAGAVTKSARAGLAVPKVIDLFGEGIVRRWCEWLRAQPAEARDQALAELAALSPEEARRLAVEAVERFLPDAPAEDKALAADYLAAIPLGIDRALLRDSATGALALPTVSFDEPRELLPLLPTDLPPYPAPCDLPGTPYRLEKLLGSGGFGAVYRAAAPSLQHLPFAIKFCLDPAMTAALHQERSLLERLMKAGGEGWSARIVRLYGYDLEHRTPFLVYEYVAGGDLLRHLARRRRELGRPLNAVEVLGLIVQVVEALAFAHGHGLVHRDLKPANVLVDGDTLKLADFGLGGVVAARAARLSRIGTTTVDFLSKVEQASLFRGAGTPLYVSPEQRRGAKPDPRHDLYSLGVVWYQLLIGDVSRELHAGWAKELTVKHQVPREHIDLIERCVGWIEERPRDAGELLPLLHALAERPPLARTVPAVDLRAGERPPEALPLPAVHEATTVPLPQSQPVPKVQSTAPLATEGEGLRRIVLVSKVRQLLQALKKTASLQRSAVFRIGALGLVVGLVVGLVLRSVNQPQRETRPNTDNELVFGLGDFGFKIKPPDYWSMQGDNWAEQQNNALRLGLGWGLGAGVVVIGLQIVLRRLRLYSIRQAAAGLRKDLMAEFPGAVQSWGGEVVLHDPASVKEILRTLESERS